MPDGVIKSDAEKKRFTGTLSPNRSGGIEKRLTPLNIAVAAAASAVLVFVIMFALGLQYVWYRNTGFREQNHPSYKAQETAYPQVSAGSVPIGGLEPDVSTRYKALQFKNPVPATAESISRGRDLFLIYCSPCHDASGDGKGIMGSVPALTLIPDKERRDLADTLSGYMSYIPSIDVNFAQEEPESWLYYTITNGGEAIMPAFKDALSPQQRWDLINYIKKVLGEAGGRE